MKTMILHSIMALFILAAVQGCSTKGNTKKKCIPCRSSALDISAEYQFAARMP
ncbi:MAG: hypothetical protein MJE63_12215 [Proteobacteria bacterium]|nr:hypothetical protein [Pseudomonadota bacterium]